MASRAGLLFFADITTMLGAMPSGDSSGTFCTVFRTSSHSPHSFSSTSCSSSSCFSTLLSTPHLFHGNGSTSHFSQHPSSSSSPSFSAPSSSSPWSVQRVLIQRHCMERVRPLMLLAEGRYGEGGRGGGGDISCVPMRLRNAKDAVFGLGKRMMPTRERMRESGLMRVVPNTAEVLGRDEREEEGDEMRLRREGGGEVSGVDEEKQAWKGSEESVQKGVAWRPPRYVWRAAAALVMAGQVVSRVVRGKVHWKNTLAQLQVVGPESLGVSLLTACFVGMAFTIQFVREFARLGLTRSVGGVLALALARELSPVVTAIIMAGRVGSSFAAELGTMQVSEQTDTLRVLKTDPVDYLVTPRVLACCLALPVLTLLCFTVGMAASVLLADAVYSVSSNIILDSAARALQRWDIVSMLVKSVVFGAIISEVSCSWGMTTDGGAKGVGESTTSAVVISLVCVFIADFVLSWCFFQGQGDALKAAMG